MLSENQISSIVVDSAVEIHKLMGSGLLETAYEACLEYELTLRGLDVGRQIEVPVIYKEVNLGLGYRADLIINNQVIIEVKAVQDIDDVHLAQLLTYLKLMDMRLGLILNFHAELMKWGIRRVVNNL